MHFHKYRDWQYLTDTWQYNVTINDRLVRVWQGTCEVCGKPKLRRQVVRKTM